MRCAATEVDPDTGIRDVAVPRTLMDNFGHADCGVYAEVIAGGEIAVGDGNKGNGRRIRPAVSHLDEVVDNQPPGIT